MHIQYCFPTAIFSTVNEQLADEMLPITKNILSDKRLINEHWKHYKTTYNSNIGQGLEKFHEFQPFINYIKGIANEFVLKQGYKPWVKEFTPTIFASEMFKGDYHDTHSHPNSLLSGVFYLQTPEGSSPLTFYDPKPRSNFFQREIEFSTDSNNNVINVEPHKGVFVMWESWLLHSVSRNTNTEAGRIALIFNLL